MLSDDPEMVLPDAQRIAVLEEQMRVLDDRLSDMESKITDIHDVMLQAKGAKWVMVGFIALATSIGAIAYYVNNLFHFR